MLVIFIIQLIIYVFFYDKTYYHIDTVKEPIIRFLFFQSMLIGLYFRVNHERYLNKKHLSNWIFLISSLVIYFITKIAFSRNEDISQFQIINQMILFITLYFVFKCFASIEGQLVKLPRMVKSVAAFISQITLQIYAVQYVIIHKFATIVFPLNWLIITSLIVISAYILYLAGNKSSDCILRFIDGVIAKLNKKEVV